MSCIACRPRTSRYVVLGGSKDVQVGSCTAFAGDGVSGHHEEISLRPGDALPIGSPIVKRFPFLVDCTSLELPSSIAADAKQV